MHSPGSKGLDVALALKEWEESGFSFDRVAEPELPCEEVDIYITKMPQGGLKGLRSILDIFEPNIPSPRVLQISKSIPCLLFSNVSFYPWTIFAIKAQKIDPCIHVTAHGDSSLTIPI